MGVGKGRTLAAVALNQKELSGATHFLFVSASALLKATLERDLAALKWKQPVNDTPASLERRQLTKPLKRGIYFVNFSTEKF